MQKFFYFLKNLSTYLINKLEHIKFITELASERPFHGSVQFSSVQFSFVSSPPHNKNAILII